MTLFVNLSQERTGFQKAQHSAMYYVYRKIFVWVVSVIQEDLVGLVASKTFIDTKWGDILCSCIFAFYSGIRYFNYALDYPLFLFVFSLIY